MTTSWKGHGTHRGRPVAVGEYAKQPSRPSTFSGRTVIYRDFMSSDHQGRPLLLGMLASAREVDVARSFQD